MGADVGDSRRKQQSFYMSSFKITVLSQVFITEPVCQGEMQSWLQLLDDRVQHSRSRTWGDFVACVIVVAVFGVFMKSVDVMRL